MSAAHNKRLPPSVSASDAHDWSARLPALCSPSGPHGRIHDSFCNEEGKKNGDSVCERRNSQDHWEIIRWSGVVDLELNGIINQAKKQARCSYIYYLHFFHFRRCNQQIYVRASNPCHGDLEAERRVRPLTLGVSSGISCALFICSPLCSLAPQQRLRQEKQNRVVVISLSFKLGSVQNWVRNSTVCRDAFALRCVHLTPWRKKKPLLQSHRVNVAQARSPEVKGPNIRK